MTETNNATSIHEATATGEQIFDIVKTMEPALFGVPRAHGIIACLTIALTLMEPRLTPEELQAGVRGASEWICLFLSTCESMTEQTGEEVTSKILMN